MNRYMGAKRTRRWSWRPLALLVPSLLAASGTFAISTAQAAPLPITIERIQPLDDAGTTLMAAREAAHLAGDPDRFKIKADVWLNNAGGSDLEVDSVTTEYPGSGIAPNSDPPTTQQILPAGDSGRVRVFDGISRELPVPLPPTLQVTIGFVGTSETFVFSLPLDFYENDTPTGSHLFPMAAADLDPGEFWAYGTRHIDDAGSGAPSTVRDRYAYDLVVRRWDGASWIRLGADGDGDPLPGTNNGDYLAFGNPIYAVADGVVVICTRGVAENVPGTLGSGGGNELWVQHGDEVVRYSHFKAGSLSSTLCPFNDGSAHDVEAMDIQVTAGQQLGQIGNTGQSSEPHLHISVHRRTDRSVPLETSFELADSRPLGFHNIRIASHDTSIDALGSSPSFRPSHGPILPSNTLIIANPCGLDDLPPTGAVEVAKHGIPGECYQDVFNQIVARGYRPVFVDGFDVGGGLFFNAIFRPSEGAWIARHGLTGTENQDLFDDLTEAGYRLHQVDSYLDGGSVRYAAIFEKRPGLAFAAFHGLNDAEYDQRVDDLSAAGFVAVNVSTVEVGGQLFWTGLFEHTSVNSWKVETVSDAEYQDTFDANVDAGRLPIYVHAFNAGGLRFITGIWVDPIGGSWAAVHGRTGTEYQADWEANTGAGRLTRAVTGYDDGAGSALFAAVWRVRPDTTLTSTPPNVTNQTSAPFEFAASTPFATFECRLDGGSFTTCSSPRLLTGLSEGSHTFRVRAVDRERVRDLTPATYTWLVDVTPPDVSFVGPPVDSKTVHGELKDDPVETTTIIGWGDVVATATDNLSGVASVEFEVNGVPVPAADVTHDVVADTWTFTFVPHLNGENTYVITVTATDQATNSASESFEIVGVKTNKPMN